MSSQATIMVCLGAAGAIAARSDIKYRQLPNWLTGMLAAGGLGFAGWAGGPRLLGWCTAHLAAALLGGAVLFAAKIIGGGDVKYYAAVSAWFPLNQGMNLLGSVSLAGFGMVLVWMIWRQWQAGPMTPEAQGLQARFPYGVPIAAGSLMAGALA